MTCIIGLAHEGAVWMAADSALSDGYEVRAMVGGKMFRLGDMLIGASGSLRMKQLIQYHVEAPICAPPMNDEGHLVTGFVANMRKVLREYGNTKVENNVEELDGNLLIGYRGHLYHVSIDHAVTTMVDGFGAIGSGREYALGALLALPMLAPRERLLRSIEIAASVCPSVGAPFVVESIRPAEA